MENQENLSVEDRFIRARLQILKKLPFIGKYAIKLGVEEDEGVGTAATDGRRVYYNKDFMSKLSEGEFNFIYTHEILHVLLNHMGRKGDRDKEIWNYACDYEIHNILGDSRYTTGFSGLELREPDGILKDSNFRGLNCYEIYDEIKDNFKEKKENNPGEHLINDHSKWEELTEEEKREIKEIVEEYLRGCGTGTGIPRIDKRIQEIIKSKRDWKDELRNFIVPSPKDYSFMTPDRRFMDGDFIIPDIGIGEKVDKVVICIDTSGSVTDKEIEEVIGEIKAMQYSVGGELEGIVCFFHTNVYNKQKIKQVEDIDLSVLEGGGTDIIEALKEVDKIDKKENIVGVIMLTDGYAPLPNKVEGEYQVLWVIKGNKRFKEPFGRKVHLE